MLSKTTLINACLGLLVAFMAIQAYGLWNRPLSIQNALSALANDAEPKPARRTQQVRRERVQTSVTANTYQSIIGKNLFSPKRAETVIEASAPEVVVDDKPLRIDGKKIELYGVVLTDDRKMALVSDPDVANRKRASRWVKLGDQLGQFVVETIAPEDIVLSDGSDRFKIVLWDQQREKQSPVPPPSNDKPTVIVTETQTPSSQSSAPSRTEAPNAAEDDDIEIIQTPFGDIKRKKK